MKTTEENSLEENANFLYCSSLSFQSFDRSNWFHGWLTMYCLACPFIWTIKQFTSFLLNSLLFSSIPDWSVHDEIQVRHHTKDFVSEDCVCLTSAYGRYTRIPNGQVKRRSGIGETTLFDRSVDVWFSCRLEHLQSFIDLRQRLQQPSHARSGRKSDVKVPSRLVINVGGTRFETFQSTLERYPNTLLGNSRRRALFYDKKNDEYFFDRHRLCFEAILYFYQSAGRLRRPDHVPVDTFLEEITFFDLGAEALAQVRQDEELVEAHKVQLPKNRFRRHLWANLEYPQYSMTAKIIHICSIFVILTSAIELAVETLPKYRGVYDNRCEYDGDGMRRVTVFSSRCDRSLCYFRPSGRYE